MRHRRFAVLSLLLCISIISALALTASPPMIRAAAANTWYVAMTGSDATGSGSSGNPWQTIAYAVSNASVVDGDTIQVAAGTYTEAVSTSKALTFKGAQSGIDARDRTGSETAWVVPSPSSPSALHATTSTKAVTVDGFKFVGGPDCVDLERATAVFNNNIVEVPADCTGPLRIYYLVRISNAGSVTIQHNDISATKAPPSLLVACIDVKISTNPGTLLVDGNRLHNAEECGGFLFEKGTNEGTMTFTNNEVYDNAGDGVSIIGKFDSLTATHNSFHDNAWCGMLIGYTGTQPATVDIQNCDIYGNGSYGVYNATTSGNLTIDAAQNFWGDGTEDYPYNPSGAAFGPDIGGVTTDPLPSPACAPSVTTNEATNVATASARLNGSLTSLGTANSVTVSFVWGTNSGSYPNETTSEVRTATGIFFFDLGGLSPSTTYYFKAKCVGNGTGYGAEKSFTTSTAPSVTTSDATNVGTNAATLNGNLTSMGTASSVTVSFVWGTSSGSYPNETTSQVRTATGVFFFDLGGLASSTTYYLKAKAIGYGTSYGTEKSFTTITPSPPSVTTNDATNVATTSATLNGNLTSLGTASSITVSFLWGTSPGSRTFETVGQVMTAPGPFSFSLTSLTPGTNYCFEAKALGHGISYGVEKSFATTTIPPSVTTNDASNVAATSARLNGNLSSLGTASSVTASFVWGTSSGSYSYETTGQVLTGTGTFVFDLDGLTPGTTYYYNARAMGDGASYGTEKSFTTAAGTTPPSVTTNEASSIRDGSARLNGNLTSLGTASSVTVSFVWGTTSGSYPYETAGQALSTPATFFFDISSLAPRTAYYFKAKAVGNGTSLGAEKSFTTISATPHFGTGFYEECTGYRGAASVAALYGQNRVCQTFTPSKDHFFDTLSLLLYGVGNPSFTVTISLYAVGQNHQPVNTALLTTAFSTVGMAYTDQDWRTFRFPSAYRLVGGVEYAIVLSANGGSSSSRVNLRTYSVNCYNYGQLGLSSDAGVTWQMSSGADMTFKEGQSTWDAIMPTPVPGLAVYGLRQAYQTFTPSRSHYFNYVSLYLYQVSYPKFTVTISLYAVDDVNHQPAGSALCSTSFSATSLSPVVAWRTFGFSTGYQVSAGTQYALVLSASSGTGSVVARTNTTGGYSGGECGLSTNGGATWQALPSPDMTFREGENPWYTSYTYSDSNAYVYGQYQVCQTFTAPTSHYLDYVSLPLYRVGSPNYTVTLSVHNVDANGQPAQPALCSTSFAASSLSLPRLNYYNLDPNSFPWYEFRFTTGYQLSQGAKYALIVSGDGGDTANRITIRFHTTGYYSGGQRGASADGGTSWQMLRAQDMAFREGGAQSAGVMETGSHEQFTGYIPASSAAYVYGQNRICQTFVPTKSHYFNQVSLWLYRVGTLSFTVTVSLYAVDANSQPVEPALCSTTLTSLSLPTTATSWRTYGFASGHQLSAGTEYALVISANGGNLYNRVNLRTSAADGYSRGQIGTSNDNGQTWQMNRDADMTFKEGQYTWQESQSSAGTGIAVSGQNQACQTFTPTRDHYLNYMSFYLQKVGLPTYTVTISLHNVDSNGQPVQPALCSTAFAASSLSTEPGWRSFRFASGIVVLAGAQYAFVISAGGSYGYVVAWANSADGYSGGKCELSANGGTSWQDVLGPDLGFREGENPCITGHTVSDRATSVYGPYQACQTFTPSIAHYFDYLSLSLYAVGSPQYTVTMSIYNVDAYHHPVGSPLCSFTFAASSVTLRMINSVTYPWYQFRFPNGCELAAGTEYALVLSADGGDVANRVLIRVNTKGTYTGGQSGASADGGATWQMIPTRDMAFIDGGMPL